MQSVRHLTCFLIITCYLAELCLPTKHEKREVHQSDVPMRCIEDLGCFDNRAPFYHPILRPVRVLPFPLTILATSYLLYTRVNPKIPQQIRSRDSDDDLRGTFFDYKRDTKIIIHGFLDNVRFGHWMQVLKDELLNQGDYNVVIVDWTGGNGAPYSQAVSNCRVVGAELAFLIQRLGKLKGIRPELCHIIGHSLGAHIAGYAGERLNKLRRITGLDPASLFFQHLSPQVRLDPGDAQFVDAIHSDSLPPTGLGLRLPTGHVDFYPNGGFRQPGCMAQRIFTWLLEGMSTGIRIFVACDHFRAVYLYIASVRNAPRENEPGSFGSECLPFGVPCSDWDSFQAGKCACGTKGSNDACVPLGLLAEKGFFAIRNFAAVQDFAVGNSSAASASPNLIEPVSPNVKKYYLKTFDRDPFCVFQFQVSVHLSKSMKLKANTRGLLYITLYGIDTVATFRLTERTEELLPGQKYTYLISSKENVDPTEKIEFEWSSFESLLFIPPERYIFGDPPQLFLRNIIVKPLISPTEDKGRIFSSSAASAIERTFCADPTKPIPPSKSIVLSQGSC